MDYTTEQDFLLKGLRENNSKVIDTIYKTCFPLVRKFIIDRYGSVEQAQDIFQDAIITLVEKLNSNIEFSLSCSIGTFLFEIAKRNWLKFLERNKQVYTDDISLLIEQTKQTIEDDYDEDDEAVEQRNKKMNNLKISLIKLGHPCDLLLNYFYIQDKSIAEISNLLGYKNEEQTKSQKYKCLIRLKKLFFEGYDL